MAYPKQPVQAVLERETLPAKRPPQHGAGDAGQREPAAGAAVSGMGRFVQTDTARHPHTERAKPWRGYYNLQGFALSDRSRRCLTKPDAVITM